MKHNDKHLKEMQNIIAKCKDVSQEVTLGDITFNAKPHYISLNYKQYDELNSKIYNGEFVDEPYTISDNGFLITAMIGDKEGYGKARTAEDGIPRNVKSLAQATHNSMDLALKGALSSYLRNKADNILINIDNKFFRQSKEKAEKYIEKNNVGLKIDEKVYELHKEFTKRAKRRKHISEANNHIGYYKETSRFVDTEGRIIKSHIHKGSISTNLKINHERGFKLEHDIIVPISKNSIIRISDLENNLEKELKYTYSLKKATTPISDRYPVVMSGGALGVLVHEALGGHLLSGSYIINGISSSFKNKIGRIILPEFLSVIDNPSDENGYGYYLFDEEGIRAQKTTLVEDGILKNYLLDRYSAQYFNTNSNGHSRFEWVTCYDDNGNKAAIIPEERVSNLEIISSNQVSEKELSEHAKRYCKDNNIDCYIHLDADAGEVNPITGQFNLFPRKAYKVFPNGKKEIITNVFVSGGAFDLLNSIEVTSDNYVVQTGICGSCSGGVPTQNVAPSAFLPNITINAIEPHKYRDNLLE